MKNLLLTFVFFLTALPKLPAQDWPQWRGPAGDNHAPAGAKAVTSWSENENVAWVSPVPGRGHASPTIVGDRIYLATADEQQQTQSLLIYDRRTGKQLTEKIAHRGGLTAKLHENNTHASSTVASEGQRVFVLFNNNEAAWITAFDLNGKQLWQQRAIGFDPQQYQFGFGSSPVVVDGLVIVASEYDGAESGIVALDAVTGEQRWKTPRQQSLSYSTPALASQGGRRFLILSGGNNVSAYNPSNGQNLWTTTGSTMATCGTMVWDNQLGLAFASGGYPETFTLAIETTGNHEVKWNNNRIRCYEQSLIVVDGHLYPVTDRGIVYCLRASDGKELWKDRLDGRFSSSPLLVDGKIYVSNESGTTFVFAASPAGYQALGKNQLGTECFATPSPSGGYLYHRYAQGSGANRKEFLAAIGPAAQR